MTDRNERDPKRSKMAEKNTSMTCRLKKYSNKLKMSSDSDLNDSDNDDLLSVGSSDSSLQSDTESSAPEPREKEKIEEKVKSSHSEEETVDKRFEKELEFVMCLANPHYIFFLAQKNYFGDPAFINYLKYLLYWCEPQYAKFVRYPQALLFLRLLQDPDFRKYVSVFNNIHLMENCQNQYWEIYQRNRLDLTLPEPEVKKPDSYPE